MIACTKIAEEPIIILPRQQIDSEWEATDNGGPKKSFNFKRNPDLPLTINGGCYHDQWGRKRQPRSGNDELLWSASAAETPPPSFRTSAGQRGGHQDRDPDPAGVAGSEDRATRGLRILPQRTDELV